MDAYRDCGVQMFRMVFEHCMGRLVQFEFLPKLHAFGFTSPKINTTKYHCWVLLQKVCGHVTHLQGTNTQFRISLETPKENGSCMIDVI